MEDRDSIDYVGRLWGRSATPCQRTSVGNNVWRVQVGGKKAMELLRLILPYLRGIKRKKAMFLLSMYALRTMSHVADRESFRPFGEMP